MSYQVLARKWRPRSFATLVGQEAAVTALSNALAQQRLHHAYLFTGTRGVGKTTLARLLAKALNCETGVTPEPCGQCAACRQIDAGRFVDLIELDAASNTGVDNIREVLDNAQYAPTSGRYKVYIIDEVHMLSKSAFNAMLKTLEEPPGHVKFILATTDPQKVPVTVLSRCLQFNLRPMTPANVSGHLAHVLAEEGIDFEAEALRLLGHAANGSMRDALSLLDQAIAYGGGRVPAEVVRSMLGSFDRGYLRGLVDALLARDGAALLRQAAEMESQGADWDNALQQLAELFQWIAVAQLAAAALPDELEDRELVETTAAAMAPDEVQLNYQIALHGRRDLPLAPDPAAGFRMTLLRLLAFRPAGNAVAAAPPGPASPPAPGKSPSLKPTAANPRPTFDARPPADAPASGRPGTPAQTTSADAPFPTAAPERSGAAHGVEARTRLRVEKAQAPVEETAHAPAGEAAPPRGGREPARAEAARPAPDAGAAPRPSPRPTAEAWDEESESEAAATFEAERAAAEAIAQQVMRSADEGDGREAPTAGAPAAGDPAAGDPAAGAPAAEAPANLATPASAGPVEFDGDWAELVNRVRPSGIARMLANEAELRCCREGRFELIVPADKPHLRDKTYIDGVRDALSRHFGQPVQVVVEFGEISGQSVSAINQQARAERQRGAEEIMLADPFVRALQQQFDATILDIKPLNP